MKKLKVNFTPPLIIVLLGAFILGVFTLCFFNYHYWIGDAEAFWSFAHMPWGSKNHFIMVANVIAGLTLIIAAVFFVVDTANESGR